MDHIGSHLAVQTLLIYKKVYKEIDCIFLTISVFLPASVEIFCPDLNKLKILQENVYFLTFEEFLLNFSCVT